MNDALSTHIKTITFEGKKPGPTVLITGAVHGNEKPGTKGIESIIRALDNPEATYQMHAGKVIFAPIVNQNAFEKNKRFIDVNLNRIVDPGLIQNEKYRNTYEAGVASNLMKLIDKCDYYVDLHTTTTQQEPMAMIFAGNDRESLNLAEMSGIKKIVLNCDQMVPEGAKTTQHYAKSANKAAVLIECGVSSDSDHSASSCANTVIRQVLGNLGMVANLPHNNFNGDNLTFYEPTEFLRRDDENNRKGQFTASMASFSKIKKGQQFFQWEGEEEPVRAPFDCVITAINKIPENKEEYGVLVKEVPAPVFA